MYQSNHIIRFDKYALITLTGISIFMPVYMYILGLLGDYHGHNTFMENCHWFGFNIAMTFSICLFVLIANVYYLHYLENHYPWRGKWKQHLCLEICGILLYTEMITTAVELVFYPFRPSGGSFWLDLTKSLFYATIFNFVIVAVYEGAYLFKQWKTALVEAEKLQKEHILSQFETLRTQINPHFLFNSLNTLSAIVQKDKEQALKFIKEFAKVYRSVLDYKDRLLITLDEELKLVNSFIYLQKMRFQDNLSIEIFIENSELNKFIPPFSLQMLIENAIKHNVISDKKPLAISISSERGYLVVKNNLQKRIYEHDSTGIGLKNLLARYEMISIQKPEFKEAENEYFAKIPLLEEE